MMQLMGQFHIINALLRLYFLIHAMYLCRRSWKMIRCSLLVNEKKNKNKDGGVSCGTKYSEVKKKKQCTGVVKKTAASAGCFGSRYCLFAVAAAAAAADTFWRIDCRRQ